MTKNDNAATLTITVEPEDEEVDNEVDQITRGKELVPSPCRFLSSTPERMIRLV